MSRIADYLAQIMSAVYGKDVRQSIHDSIQECYTDVQNGVTLAQTAAGNAETRTETAITNVNTAITNAETATNLANSAALQVTQLSSDFGMRVVNGKITVEVTRDG